MKTVKKNVYYCDHCKKKGLAKFYVVKHEKGCTNNPNRVCGLCGRSDISELVTKIKAMFAVETTTQNFAYLDGFEAHRIVWSDKEITLAYLREWVDDCPNCLLALVRQSGLLALDYEKYSFNYKQESSVAFANKCSEDRPNVGFYP